MCIYIYVHMYLDIHICVEELSSDLRTVQPRTVQRSGFGVVQDCDAVLRRRLTPERSKRHFCRACLKLKGPKYPNKGYVRFLCLES